MKKNIVFLVADADIENALHGLFSVPVRLGIREIDYDIFRHPQRDPGCRTEGHEFLRLYHQQYDYAMLLFDHEGCGAEGQAVGALQNELEGLLERSGWKERCRVIVLVPELEIWVWSDSPKVDELLGWQGQVPALRDWLVEQGLWESNSRKPDDPKRAVEEALQQARKPRSSALYRRLAAEVSFRNCIDSAFHRLQETLLTWFILAD